MIFKKGDRVKFLNDVGGGIITRIDNKTAYVENEDGFEVPSSISQLLKAEVPREDSSPFTRAVSVGYVTPTNESELNKPDEDRNPDKFTEGYIDLTEEPDEQNIDMSVNILLAWIRQNKKNGKTACDLYLVNDCSYNIMYVAAMVKDAAYCGIQAGTLESDTTIHLTQISGDTLKSVKSVHFDIIFFKKGSYLPQEPMRYELKIDEFYLTDPVNYVANPYFDEKALIYNISEEYLMAEIENVGHKHLEEQKKQIDNTLPNPPAKAAVSDMEEIDLHIEQLVDNPKAFTPAEMLDIQMGRFTNALEEAIRKRIKRIVFIHGVGNGRLRLEIKRTLDKKYPKLRYQDASFKEYGYGATMIMVNG